MGSGEGIKVGKARPGSPEGKEKGPARMQEWGARRLLALALLQGLACTFPTTTHTTLSLGHSLSPAGETKGDAL